MLCKVCTLTCPLPPPRCNHCILSKQTCSSVPNMREGNKATKPLERVFVDLYGPMPCHSQPNRLYSMNVIDDFLSYAWSIPLRSKDEAASVLQLWHQAVENQSGHRLKILISNNGELISKSMQDWASTHGVDHQCTAPYMSAQNGHAECLHQTLLGKAQAICLSCNAPPSFWDKFCAISAYLSNLTALSSLNGRMPYEVWTGCIPSLSHLWEIGCRAFMLIQTNNLKIFCRSHPCILIGYAPHAKAYHLWDMIDGSIFNSFHVTFVKHLDEQPADLLPGTMISIEPDVRPSWDSSPPPSLTVDSAYTVPSSSLGKNHHNIIMQLWVV